MGKRNQPPPRPSTHGGEDVEVDLATKHLVDSFLASDKAASLRAKGKDVNTAVMRIADILADDDDHEAAAEMLEMTPEEYKETFFPAGEAFGGLIERAPGALRDEEEDEDVLEEPEAQGIGARIGRFLGRDTE
jgi:hypothetical protein